MSRLPKSPVSYAEEPFFGTDLLQKFMEAIRRRSRTPKP